MRTVDNKEPQMLGEYDGDPIHDLVGGPFDPRSAWNLTIAQAAAILETSEANLAQLVECGTVPVSGLGPDGTPRVGYDQVKLLLDDRARVMSAGPDDPPDLGSATKRR